MFTGPPSEVVLKGGDGTLESGVETLLQHAGLSS
jgi:hypothetical protein